MLDHPVIMRIVRGLARDRERPVAERIGKGARLVTESIAARVAFRSCRIGPRARLDGRVRTENRGQISIGQDFIVHGDFLPVEILCGEGGTLEVGDDVWINFGSVIAARRSVKIGDRVMIGQHCIVSDVDIPEHAVQDVVVDARPVEIGDDAWLAGRVTVAPGVKIGARAVITAGSVVTSDVPPGVVAGGSPARVLRTLNGSAALDHSSFVAAAPAQAPVKTAEQVSADVASAEGLLIADFTIDNLADELKAPGFYPPLRARVAPYGQVAQSLLQPADPEAADYCVIWTWPQFAVPLFARVLGHEEVTDEQLLAEVDAFTALIEGAARGYKAVFVPTWVLPPWTRGLGMTDCRNGGASRALVRMNLRLMENLELLKNTFVLDAQRWFAAAQRTPFEPKAWYIGKIAVPQQVMLEAATDIRSAFAALKGQARKLLVLDLDDTLWGGVVGDAGWENLRLGGHDSIGEAFVDFQKLVKNLKRRGIVLGIVSKNEESVALEAIRSHPEMVLKEDDFVGWRINWQDKAENIAELTSELHLGLQSVVFIDDNPLERARVREALPEVYVPEWPVDKLEYPHAFGRLRCFDTPSIVKEDLQRTAMYAEERKRTELRQQLGSIDEWLLGLGTKVKVEPLNARNLARVTQLLNKTNQLNLTTRRLSEAELTQWVQADRVFYALGVSDRFGDSGLAGLISVEADGDQARIVDFVLSCRVMGRKVEETMLHIATEWAMMRGAKTVVAEHLPTAKNKPCLSFFERSGFESQDQKVFAWSLAQTYALPAPIALEWARS